jgi:hypothetical protein
MGANIGVDDTIPECGVRVSGVTYRERLGSIRCHSGEREQICLRPCFADVLLSHKPTAIDRIRPERPLLHREHRAPRPTGRPRSFLPERYRRQTSSRLITPVRTAVTITALRRVTQRFVSGGGKSKSRYSALARCNEDEYSSDMHSGSSPAASR